MSAVCMLMQQPKTLSAHRLRELAVQAGVDPRTIARVLRGETGRETISTHRARQTLRDVGLLEPEAPEKGGD